MADKYIPEYKSKLKHRIVKVPESIYRASGIKIFEKRIKSFLFTTDIAIINNTNADAILAVYPFTPSLEIISAVLETSSKPVFAGVGGGLTTGHRSTNIAIQADLMGCYGVLVNAPIPNDTIKEIAEAIEIPLIATVVSLKDDIKGKVKAGADMINVSGGKNTTELVKMIRDVAGPEFPIMATGGPNDETILKTIESGANAISYTPPTSGEIFHDVMANYREEKGE